MVERETVNLEVMGSSPIRRVYTTLTMIFCHLLQFLIDVLSISSAFYAATQFVYNCILFYS